MTAAGQHIAQAPVRLRRTCQSPSRQAKPGTGQCLTSVNIIVVSRRSQWTFVILLVPVLGYAADYAGPEACRLCHPAEYATQSKSRHENALRPSAETPLPSLLVGA